MRAMENVTSASPNVDAITGRRSATVTKLAFGAFRGRKMKPNGCVDSSRATLSSSKVGGSGDEDEEEEEADGADVGGWEGEDARRTVAGPSPATRPGPGSILVASHN